MGARAPYSWSIATECNDVVDTTSEFGIKELPGSQATYAGGSLKGQPRKFAIIAPDNPWYQDCVNEAIAIDKAHGLTISDNIQYQLDLSTLSSQAASVISKLANDGITTVFCGCDPVFPVYLTSRAHEQSYQPEWIVAGVALTDADIVGQLFQQNEWTHAVGISYQGNTIQKQATLGYAAYKSVRSDEPATIVDLIYAQMYEMVIGLQMAGPNLTPQTFEAGMRKYPGSSPTPPTPSSAPGRSPPAPTPPSATATSSTGTRTRRRSTTARQGAYVVASPRYLNGQYPTGPPPVPATFGQ